MLKKVFFFGLVSRSYFYRFLNRQFNVRDFQIVVFALKVLQKCFSGKSRSMNFGIDSCRFLEGLGATESVFWFLSLENRLQNRRILAMKADPEMWNWGS